MTLICPIKALYLKHTKIGKYKLIVYFLIPLTFVKPRISSQFHDFQTFFQYPLKKQRDPMSRAVAIFYIN